MEHPSNAELVDQISTGAGTLGAKITELGTSLSTADYQLQIAHLANFISPITEMPNLTMTQVEKLPGPLGELTRYSELPAIAAVKAGRFAFKEAKFEFEMNVNSHTEHKTETGVESGVEAGASGGWGPVSAHVSMHVDVSHKDEQTRTTDMSARMHMELTMEREEAAEGLQKFIDQANKFSDVANEIRLRAAVSEAQRIQEDVVANGVPEEAAKIPVEAAAE